jgi:integrase
MARRPPSEGQYAAGARQVTIGPADGAAAAPVDPGNPDAHLLKQTARLDTSQPQAIAGLRNRVGTGHGRAVAVKRRPGPALARPAIGQALATVTYLLRVHDEIAGPTETLATWTPPAVIAAARALFNRAVADGLIDPAANPAHRVPKPRRLPSTRRALTADELDAINVAARCSGNDVVLDALLLRLHTETACRRGGALGLRVMDLDVDRGLVRLREKGGTLRWQPVTVHLAQRLAEHANARGAVAPTDGLLRYRDGRALTSRRYDHLWHRLGQQLPWVAAQGISTHWLRHTTLTWVERHFGYGVARAYAGHTDSTGAATTTYIKADLQAVATALAAMTGQPHLLAVVETEGDTSGGSARSSGQHGNGTRAAAPGSGGSRS